MKKAPEGNERMIKIALYVRQGAMAYLKQQYKVVALIFVGLVILFAVMAFGFGIQNKWVPVAFLTGGFFSALSGYFGMKTATYASARTANAARNSINKALQIALRSGAVMGLVVVGLGLLDISLWYIILNTFIREADATHKLIVITTTMLYRDFSGALRRQEMGIGQLQLANREAAILPQRYAYRALLP